MHKKFSFHIDEDIVPQKRYLSGYRFKQWEVISGGVELDNYRDYTTSFEIKNADVETGRSFSREYGLRKSVTEGDIPYAVHGWSKDFRDYDEMRSFLAEHGIEI